MGLLLLKIIVWKCTSVRSFQNIFVVQNILFIVIIFQFYLFGNFFNMQKVRHRNLVWVGAAVLSDMYLDI